MQCALFTRIVAFAASAGAGLGAGAPEAQPTGANSAPDRSRLPRAVASVSVSATVVDGARVRLPRLDRLDMGEPSLVQPNDAPFAAARSTRLDRERGVIVISLDFS
ncbi:MAG: hypothetical protein V2I27_01615 [Erythrobacter sp.]|jgi:hypothetical protein|nr:hypothetical protein [Erythrobacter sp.]